MKILAVDYGDVRTGLAACDSAEMLASPLQMITERSVAGTVEQIAATARERQVGQVVVGLPLNMNGTRGERAELCTRVAELLQEQLPDVPVKLWDERGTTKTAAGYMNETNTRGKKRKGTIDSASAAVILDSYLAFRRNHGEK